VVQHTMVQHTVVQHTMVQHAVVHGVCLEWGPGKTIWCGADHQLG
jgi:hypothetical protein